MWTRENQLYAEWTREHHWHNKWMPKQREWESINDMLNECSEWENQWQIQWMTRQSEWENINDTLNERLGKVMREHQRRVEWMTRQSEWENINDTLNECPGKVNERTSTTRWMNVQAKWMREHQRHVEWMSRQWIRRESMPERLNGQWNTEKCPGRMNLESMACRMNGQAEWMLHSKNMPPHFINFKSRDGQGMFPRPR